MCEDIETPEEPQMCRENAADDRLEETYGALYGNDLRCDKPYNYCELKSREVPAPVEPTPAPELEYYWECTPPTSGGGSSGSGG